MFLYCAVSSPSDHSKRFTLFLPWHCGRPVHSDPNSASPGSILAMQQLRATTKSLTFPPLSTSRYSWLIQLSQLGCHISTAPLTTIHMLAEQRALELTICVSHVLFPGSHVGEVVDYGLGQVFQLLQLYLKRLQLLSLGQLQHKLSYTTL